MGVPANILRFNKITILVLSEIYQKFPVEVMLDTKKIARELNPALIEKDVDVLELNPIVQTISFLAEEGFLTCGTIYRDLSGVTKVRLTAKGLSVLGAMPASIENGQKTVGYKISEIARNGLSTVGNDMVTKIVGQIMNFSKPVELLMKMAW